MTKPRVLLRGDGIAARCCAKLLSRSDVALMHVSPRRPRVPAIMISQATQQLFCDVFEQPDLFAGITPITRRIVAWGGAEPLELSHFASVAAETDLLARLGYEPADASHDEPADWIIHASAPLPAESALKHCGSRNAVATSVQLKSGARGDACWVESTEHGWLFLLPCGAHTGWMLRVGTESKLILDESRLVAAQIDSITSDPQTFASHPRIADPLAGPHWLACGTAAMGFDPICGDGSGNAIREAILAAAVVRADVPQGELAKHYTTRLVAGFHRHLAACAQFYATGGKGPWWQQQLESVREGAEWCAQRMRDAPEFQFRLRDFDLERVSA